MATSPIYNWPEPDNTDLVKNGALAMRTLGDAIDTTMATMVPKSIVDAKGDLIAGTAADTAARLAVGNNGETLVADSSTATGLTWNANYAAGKNKIINGAFDIWQRGTSVNLTNGTNALLADRFNCLVNFSAGTASISQQTFTPGTAPVSGYEGTYFQRISTGTTATYLETFQRIENVRTFAGQTVTFSFWAKASSAFTIKALLSQTFGSGGSSAVNYGTQNFNLTTSWVRYTWTVTLNSLSGKTVGTNNFLAVYLFQDTGALGGLTFDTWGWQLEQGSVATAFQTATGTLQGELAACQRYYYRNGADTVYQTFGNGSGASTTIGTYYIQHPVPMRVAPTSIDYSTLSNFDTVSVAATASSVVINSNQNGKNGTYIQVTNSSAVLTQYRPYFLIANNSSSAYLGFGAEL